MRLPSGRKITLFFYDGPLSRAVAFEGLLGNGETFARRLLDGFSPERAGDQLVHIATDGESYGHHHRFGDMALAYAVHYIDSRDLATITNYGEYLEKHPPVREVDIVENTSWSCAHGIERWRSDCGCHTGGRPDWNQKWRAPLREALDWLRDGAARIYEAKGTGLFRDPWSARDEFIQVILDRDPENVTRFLEQQTTETAGEEERSLALKLLEMQRHAMLMYTSCGWFFDDLSGIETVQIIQYAGRVLQLCREVSGEELEPGFLDILAKAKSNLSERGDGRQIYKSAVKPAMVDLRKVAAHYAMSSLFEEYTDQAGIYCYRVDRRGFREWEAGRAKLAAGRASVTSQITLDSDSLCFGVLHLGDHNISCGIAAPADEGSFDTWVGNLSEHFVSADFVSTFAELERDFGPYLYTLRDLFRDEQRKILDIVLDATLEDAETSYRQLYDYHAPLLRFLKDLDIPPPKALYTAGEFILNLALREVFEEEEGFDLETARTLLDEVAMEGVSLDEPALEIAVRRKIETLMERFSQDPEDTRLLQWLEEALEIQARLPFDVNLGKTQNIFYEMLQGRLSDSGTGKKREQPIPEWWDRFKSVGRKLSFWIP
jgi:hypothetical protein